MGENHFAVCVLNPVWFVILQCVFPILEILLGVLWNLQSTKWSNGVFLEFLFRKNSEILEEFNLLLVDSEEVVGNYHLCWSVIRREAKSMSWSCALVDCTGVL